MAALRAQRVLRGGGAVLEAGTVRHPTRVFVPIECGLRLAGIAHTAALGVIAALDTILAGVVVGVGHQQLRVAAKQSRYLLGRLQRGLTVVGCRGWGDHGPRRRPTSLCGSPGVYVILPGYPAPLRGRYEPGSARVSRLTTDVPRGLRSLYRTSCIRMSRSLFSRRRHIYSRSSSGDVLSMSAPVVQLFENTSCGEFCSCWSHFSRFG